MCELDEGTIIHELLELFDFRVGGGYMMSPSILDDPDHCFREGKSGLGK